MGIKNIWPFRKNTHARFETLVSPHMNNLYKLAYRLTGQRDYAEDLVQDLLLKVYPRLEEMQGIEKLAAWLSRVLYRLFIDQYRRQKRSPIHLMSDEAVIYDTHASNMAGPSEVANTALTQKLINTALEQLSVDRRALIMLHDVEDYSLQEINEMTGIPIGTIKSRLSRARNKLREIIQIREPDFVDSVNTAEEL
jgi:RNA polymerase sigma-70 factor (ECF subfamily)